MNHCTDSVYPSEARTHNWNYFEIDKKRNVPSVLDMSNKEANDNFYLTDARNIEGPRLLKGNRSYHLQDSRQRKEKEPEKVEWTDYICFFEHVSQWNNWSKNEKAAQLARSLRGPAQRILGDLKRDQLIITKHWCQFLPRDSIPQNAKLPIDASFGTGNDNQERRQPTMVTL